MAMKFNQSLKQTQSLTMTPQLQQAIEMLTYTHLELSNKITEQLQENPLLEESGTELTKDELAKRDSIEVQSKEATSENFSGPELIEGGKDQFDWQKYIEAYDSHSSSSAPRSAANFNANDEQPNYENMVSRGANLVEHLLWQLQMDQFDESERAFLAELVHNLTDEGYLDSPLEEIASNHDLALPLAEELLRTVQQLDPLGCGARDLKECLLIQADRMPDHVPLVEKIIKHHLEDLQRKDLKGLASKLGVNYQTVKLAESAILSLNPKPGRLISPEDAHYVVPDIYVREVGGELKITLNDEGVPPLRISKLYQSLIKGQKGKDTKEAQEFVKEKLKSAMWLIKSIESRQNTIRKVSEAIVRFQPEFFRKGPGHLKPMIRKDIANEIGMHESTVSRATKNKYMHTPIGTFELSYFFSSGVGGKNGGVDIASENLKIKIKKLVDSENKRRPLSDQKIVDLLRLEDIEIARRTVAKYREILNILPSSKRKQLI